MLYAWLAVNKLASSFGLLFFVCVLKHCCCSQLHGSCILSALDPQVTPELVAQTVTIQAVACATLVNVGSQLAASSHPVLATFLFSGSSVFGLLIYKGFKRVRRIDKFERGIHGGS